MTPAQRKLVDIKLYTRQPESATTHPISEELLSRLDDCRHLLPAPGPSMVGQLISEIRRLRGVLKSSFAAPAGSVNAWLDKELGQIGIYMRQSGHHKNMLAYLKALREEITMTETFLREDGYSPNDQAQRPG